MIPLKLNKEECVLVSGSFSREDVLGLNENPTLLAAKVSVIKNTIVNLYVKGYKTYLFTSNGLFDLIVANLINELNTKGLTIDIIYINRYPETAFLGNEMTNPEQFAHLCCSFSESKDDFVREDFDSYLHEVTGCVLSPSKVKSKSSYIIPHGEILSSGLERLPN